MLTSFAALLTIFIAPMMRRLRSLFLVLDALGLVAFTLIGCMTALEMGQGMLVASISGVITGCSVASCAISSATTSRWCSAASFTPACRSPRRGSTSAACISGAGGAAMLLTLFGGFLVRLLAIRFHWEMPKFHYNDQQ